MTPFERVQRMLAEQLNLDPRILTPEFSLLDQMRKDSLEMVELWVCLEDEFGIILEEAQAQQIVTLQDLVDLVEGQLSRRTLA